ncbi:MAG: diguanylate cyclase [gamma proteobacterium symbiont of Bathyaustriella thionipta]|nr:diguanylate cyclase [gamma proteobacterium symbiont of Bathyaustriella thionipta]
MSLSAISGRLSIRSKLMLLLLATSIISMSLTIAAFIFSDRYSTRQTLAYIVASQANMIGSSSTAALSFGDHAAAEEILGSLIHQSHILSARIYDTDERVFAEYFRPGISNQRPMEFHSHDYSFAGNQIDLYHPILLDDELIGTVHLRANTQELGAHFLRYGQTVFIALAISLFIAFMVSSRLQRTVSRPLTAITGTMRRVARDQDYSVRVELDDENSLSTLADDLNEMLNQIQLRNKQLQDHQKNLQKHVDERTAELSRLTEKFRFQAEHEPLTGLPNRSSLLSRLQQLLEQKNLHEPIHALLFLDLDQFKVINDTYGHEVGDQILIQAARRIEKCMGPQGYASRLGGDEFILLLPDIKSAVCAEETARRIVRELSRPFQFNAISYRITSSIGISLYPDDADDAETLIGHADAAMYKTKASGKNGISFYSPNLHEVMKSDFQMERALQKALQEQQFEIRYQVLLNSDNGELDALRVQLHWLHPLLGEIPAQEFLPIAESKGLIGPLNEWLLQQLCERLSRWQQAGRSGMRMIVHWPTLLLQQHDLSERIDQLLQQYHISADQIELEISETGIAAAGASVFYTLKALHKLGLAISLDGLGVAVLRLINTRELLISHVNLNSEWLQQPGERSAQLLNAIRLFADSLQLDFVVYSDPQHSNPAQFIKHPYVQVLILSDVLSAAEFEQRYIG